MEKVFFNLFSVVKCSRIFYTTIGQFKFINESFINCKVGDLHHAVTNLYFIEL